MPVGACSSGPDVAHDKAVLDELEGLEIPERERFIVRVAAEGG
jgi:hypothetical protein